VKIADDNNQVHVGTIEALTRCLLSAIRTYFESEEGKAAFEEWKSQQNTNTPSVPTQKKLTD
jgi:hypothetical protein